MKINQTIAAAALLWAVIFSLPASAQNNIVTVTNVVTVLVTNVVTITNIVATVPAAPAPAATPAAVEPITKYPWNSSVSVGLTLTRGNSHTLLYAGGLETAKKTPENEYQLGAAGAFGSQDSKDSVNNYGGFSQWNHLFTPKLYSYLRAEVKRDVIADVDYRFNIGPGVGYYLIKEVNTTLSTEAGAGYQYEHLGDEFNSFATARLAEKFEHKFSDRARVWQSVEWLPQVDELDNYLLNFELGAETFLTKVFSLKTTLQDSYQSQPAAGRQKNDVKIISGISYKF